MVMTEINLFTFGISSPFMFLSSRKSEKSHQCSTEIFMPLCSCRLEIAKWRGWVLSSVPGFRAVFPLGACGIISGHNRMVLRLLMIILIIHKMFNSYK